MCFACSGAPRYPPLPAQLAPRPSSLISYIAPMNPTSRLASVDALRGLAAAALLPVSDPGDRAPVYAPLEHSAWHGCTPPDLVFPFFLFIVGVSVTLAFAPRLEAGVATATLRDGASWRAVRIVGL